MKKYLFPALALGLVMTSCQSDEPFAPGEGGEKQVTFTLNVPGELGTRAAAGANQSDKGGATNQGADQIKYTLVLQANNDTQILNHDQATVSGTTATFKPTVVLGREYTITAYASLKDAWNGVNPIEITNSFNDESKDAYFKTLKYNFANGDLQPLTLTRPFGKLRLIAEDYDPTKTKVEKVTVTYNNPQEGTFNPTTEAFTLATGNATGTTKDFGYYEAADVTGAHTIFAEYLPAPKEGEYPVTFTVLVKYDGCTETYSRTFNDIPVRRNALTTLKGNFFTANSEIKVEVKDAFEGQIPGNDEEQLIIAAAMGGAYTLQGDIELSKPLNITTNMTLNLNGNTITAANAKGNGAAIEVAKGVSAKLMGGTIKNTTPNGDAAINNAGELVLDDISIEGAPLADGGYSAYAVVSSGKLTIGEGVNVRADRGCLKFSGAGETVINGGTFTNKDIGSRSLTTHVVDVEEGGSHKLTINGGTFAHRHKATSGGVVICNRTKGTVYVNGGNFSGGNYYGNNNLSDYGYGGTFVVTGGTYSAKPAAKYIADGYNVIETEVDGVKYYSVVPEGAVIENPIVSASQLQALGNTTVSGTYNLLADIDMSGLNMQPITVSGNNSELIFNGNGHTIKNLNLVNSTINVDVAGLFTTKHAAKKLTVSDLKIVNATSNSNDYSSVVFAYNSDGCEVNLNNVDVEGATINGKTASALVGYTTNNVNLTNCDVNNITMTGERADKIGAFVGTANGANCTVTVSNCTNNAEYKDAGRVIKGATMTIDGMQYVANNDALANALNSGANNILLAAGEFEMPTSFKANNVTISGADKENSILKITSQLRAENKSLTLKNLTTKVPTGLYYSESTFAWIHYLKNFSMINCNSDGRIRLNSHSATIEKCRFDVTTSSGFDGYAIFYYGPTASNVKVSNSVFNTVGKAIVLYNEGKPVLNLDVTNCQFKSSASTDKAAIQMHTEYGISGTVDIVNSTATGFANINGGLWNEVNNNTKVSTDNFEITVDGVKVH